MAAHAVEVEAETPSPIARAASPPVLPPDLRPLTGTRADESRRVLVPRDLWPDYECNEHEGEGWEAVIQRCTRRRTTVRFVDSAFGDEHLAVAVLRPL